jgi:putative transcriptional regulator
MSKNVIQSNIRTLRFMADEMTQQQLADEVEVSRQTIVAIEKGKYSPSLELAFKIARVFDKPLEEVFTYAPEEKKTKKKK